FNNIADNTSYSITFATSPLSNGMVLLSVLPINGAVGTTQKTETLHYGFCNAPPTLTGPMDVTVNVGGTAHFSVTSSPSSGYSYQWFYDDSNGDVAIPGATGTTLDVTNVYLTKNGWTYHVTASWPCGATTASVQSRDALLTVSDPTGPIITPT